MKFWTENPDWLNAISSTADRSKIFELRHGHLEKLLHESWLPYRNSLAAAPDIDTQFVNFEGSAITIGKESELDLTSKSALQSSLETFCPWKKGPFSLFDIEIDSEWQSQIKWDRISPFIGSLENKVVADIGCHNGYFMYKMVPFKPKAVIGFEPVPKHWYNFQLINRYAKQKNISLELFGVEDIDLFPNTFDTIFCMGILYHHTDPISLIRKMRNALRKKGQIIIDCQGITGDNDFALVPKSRYAGAKGVWYLPTISCLRNWIQRAGLQMETIYSGPLTPVEQRRTNWADIKSLKDFLTPDMLQTVEGYPAPQRFYVIARN